MPNSLSSKILYSLKQLLVGKILYTVVGFISAYAFAKQLGPETYGTWQTAITFLGYSVLFAMGLPFVMRRDFIQFRKEGLLEDAYNMANQVLSYSLLANPVLSLLLIIYAFFFVHDKNFFYGLLAVALLNLFNIIGGFGDILAKAYNNYSIIKKSQFILSVFLVFTIALVYLFGYFGLIWGFIVAYFANSIYYYITRPFYYKWYWNNSLLKKMMVIGIPLYFANIVQTVFSSIDRLIIAGTLSFQEVGFYSLASLVKTPLTLLVSSLSIVVFTELNEKFGKDNSVNVVKLHLEVPQILVSYLLPPIMILGIIILPAITTFFLPKYIPGIIAAQISTFSVFFLLLTGFSSNALFILNKQKLEAFSFLIVGIINTLGSFLVIKIGYGINGVASISVVSYFVYDFIMTYWVYKNINDKNHFKIQITKYIPIVYVLLIYAFDNYFIRANNVYIESILQAFLFLVFMVPYTFYIIKKIKTLNININI